MAIYSFGVSTDQIPEGDLFTQVIQDTRTEAQQRYTPLALHNDDSKDLQQARKHADEIINVSGAEVKIHVRTENEDYDHVWDSDSDPTYWNAVTLKGFFKPQPLEAELKKWGSEVINKTEIVFSHRQLYEEFGERMLRTGDVVKLPYNSVTQATDPKYFRVLNGTPSGNFRYNWLYFTCQLEVLTADVTVRPAEDLPMPVDEEIRSGGVYREGI